MGLDATRRRQWIHRQGVPCSPCSFSGICDISGICGFNGLPQIHSPFRLWVRYGSSCFFRLTTPSIWKIPGITSG